MLEADEEKIAKLGVVFSDITRVRIINFLLASGQSNTMNIATSLGVSQPRVSSHLAIMLKHRLASVIGSGRHRFYSIDEKKVRPVLRGLSTLVSTRDNLVLPGSKRAAREVRDDSTIRRCRTCYDHLAGVTGIELLKTMIDRGWLIPSKRKDSRRQIYDLTKLGLKSMLDRDVNVEGARRSKRNFAYGCLDWTERGPHLGGSLGSAVLTSILQNRFAKRMNGTRALKELKPISKWFA